MISCAFIPFATRLTTRDTVTRIPRMQARPPITSGSNVIRSNPSIEPTPFPQFDLCDAAHLQTRPHRPIEHAMVGLKVPLVTHSHHPARVAHSQGYAFPLDDVPKSRLAVFRGYQIHLEFWADPRHHGHRPVKDARRNPPSCQIDIRPKGKRVTVCEGTESDNPRRTKLFVQHLCRCPRHTPSSFPPLPNLGSARLATWPIRPPLLTRQV